MKALARIVAEADGRGGTRLSTLYGEAPLLPRQTGPGEVHLVGGAAGPLGGDELFLEVRVGHGARLTLRTVAASLALPGSGRSVTRVTAAVDGHLDWWPEPTIAVRGCDHVIDSHVELGPEATLSWREELVWGRHREEGGDLLIRTTVRRAGQTLFRHDLALGPSAPGWNGPAVLGGARTTGTLLAVGPTAATVAAARQGDGAAVVTMPLGPGLALTTATAPAAHLLRAALTTA